MMARPGKPSGPMSSRRQSYDGLHASRALLSELRDGDYAGFVQIYPANCASVEDPQHIRYEENQQDGSQSYARTPTVAPAAMTVVPSTAA